MTDQLVALGDAELTAQARAGDQHAIVELWTEHFPATLAAARRYANQPRDAEEIASDAFAGMLAALASGKGPADSVRGYLVTSVRNLAASRARRSSASDVLTDSSDTFDRAGHTPADPVARLGELGLVREAFATLPRRWQTVLWRSAVDADSNVAIGHDMGISPNAVAALSRRARRGLRTAYLQAHVSRRGVTPECQPYIAGLADFAVNEEGASADLRDHVAGCDRCPGRVAELRLVEQQMGALLGPAILSLVPAKLALAGAATTGAVGSGAAAKGAVAGKSALVGKGALAGKGATVGKGSFSSLWWLVGAATAGTLVVTALVWPRGDTAAPVATPRQATVTTTTSAPLPTVSVTPTASPTRTLVTPRTALTPKPTTTVTPPVTHSPTTTPRPVRTSTTTPAPPPPSSPPAPPPPPPASMTLQVSGSRDDTAMAVQANIQGVSGPVQLIMTVPSGVTLTSTAGDWTGCAQSGGRVTCTGAARSSDRWAGTLHTTWAASIASGKVTAQVSGRYDSGAGANASVQTTWYP